uniref:START domain-containing protein n=1 Tax=Plectus sambesii TaxID=2011161 RepID=A0A914WTR1_9BILA
MIKARTEFADVSPSVAYDVLHDPQYRLIWDKYMMGAKDVGLLNPNNDVCYYALRSFPPFRHRDFVLQRSWLDLGDEKLIFSHSICHDDFPPKPNCIRATVFLTGYLIRRLGDDGCQVTYFTHSDPKGKLPSWMVNRLTKIVAPKVIKRLHQACLAYPAWKSQHGPDWKPWSHPEQQMNMSRVRVEHCRARAYDQETVDESGCVDAASQKAAEAEEEAEEAEEA